MLIHEDKKYIKAAFTSEDELEQVVVKNYEFIFGPSSIYLPKKLIKTSDGFGTIPDGFAIDLASKKWYLVEAELLKHQVWSHIAPQVSKQIIAAKQPLSKRTIIDLAVELYKADVTIKEKFAELGIRDLDVRRVLIDIVDKDPEIGIPIDEISQDLFEWARTLRYPVKLWLINKFVEFGNPANTIYELPEEFRPELDTESENNESNSESVQKSYNVSIKNLVDAGLLFKGEVLQMTYKPKNGGHKKSYEAIVLDDGSLRFLNQEYTSPSYAALAGIQDAGSNRQTVNGWTTWKTDSGVSLNELRDKYLTMPMLAETN